MKNLDTSFQWVILLAALGAILAVATSVVHSFDVFWQLQSGRYMVETGEIIRQDLFTLAADVPRFEHCWLHDIIIYGIYLVGGYPGLSIWKGVIILLAVVCLIMTARIRNSSLVGIMLVLPLTLLTTGGWLERPQIWSFLMTGLVLFILEQYRRQPSHIVFMLFPISIAWANLHAGSVLIIPLFIAYLLGNLVENLFQHKKFAIKDWKRFLCAGILVVFGGLSTPYSTDWLKTLINAPKLGGNIQEGGERVAPMTQMFNMDWTHTSFAAEPLFYYSLAGVLLLLLFTLKRVIPSDFFLLAGMALMGLSLVRHIPFYYFVCVAILPRYIDVIGSWIGRKILPALRMTGKWLAIGFAGYLFWILYQPAYNVYGAFNVGLRSWHYPVEATSFLEEQDLAPNLYNTYDWGGYMAWRLYPDYLVFWDGRQDSAEMFNLGWQVMAGKPTWSKILDRFKVNTIVTRSLTIDTGQKYPLLDRLAESPQWHLVFRDESSMVFVRDGTVAAEWLHRYRLPKEQIHQTVLSEAHLMLSVNPGRYMAWWEMSQIYFRKRQFQQAQYALDQHLARAPRVSPQAKMMQRRLAQILPAH